jgi:ABC-type lipoprotein export system ATPase subunit
MTKPLVRLDGVCRSLTLPGGATIEPVKNATAIVEPGSRIAIVGPSGSGKTTLLHLLAALDRPTRGTVTWPALAERSGPDEPCAIGVAFQSPSLIPWLTVGQNVALPLLAGGTDEVDSRPAVAHILIAFNVDLLGERMPEEISGGEAQRVAMARALVCRPGLVLADEPTGQLDHATASAVIDALLALTAPNGALVVSTHDERVAERFDQRWTMIDGHLEVA